MEKDRICWTVLSQSEVNDTTGLIGLRNLFLGIGLDIDGKIHKLHSSLQSKDWPTVELMLFVIGNRECSCCIDIKEYR
jgi:hypothetical protein